MPKQDKCREAFEKWARNRGLDLTRIPAWRDDYSTTTTQWAWEAWEACWNHLYPTKGTTDDARAN